MNHVSQTQLQVSLIVFDLYAYVCLLCVIRIRRIYPPILCQICGHTDILISPLCFSADAIYELHDHLHSNIVAMILCT